MSSEFTRHTVYVGDTASADWEDCRPYSYPNVQAAKKFADGTANETRLHAWVWDGVKHRIVHEAHPPPTKRRVLRKSV